MMKWLRQLFCKHLLISKYPIEVPEIWGWVQVCGKCGQRKDVTRQVLFGKIEKEPPGYAPIKKASSLR